MPAYERIISYIGEVAEHTFLNGNHSIEAQLSIKCPRLLENEAIDEIVEIASRCPSGFRARCGHTEQLFIYNPSEPFNVLIAHAVEHGTARRAAERSLHLSKETLVEVDGQTLMDKQHLGPSTPAIIEVKIRSQNPSGRIDFRVNLGECLSEAIKEIEGVVAKSS